MHDGWWDGPLPARPDFGARYPWQMVRMHALSRAFRLRVDQAIGVLDRARAVPVDWSVCLSGGKDSTAVAMLCLRLGWAPRAVSIRDGLCWPGEDRYLDALAERCGLALRRVVVAEDLQALARSTPGALMLDQEDRAGALSGHWFAAANADHPGGKVWGLRADESCARRIRRRVSGPLYETRHDGWRCAPLADWSALDVHALLAVEGVPPHPVYLCVDPGVDALKMRHAWWVAGGRQAAEGGHYVWLRRWWPELWDLAVEIDPGVAMLS